MSNSVLVLAIAALALIRLAVDPLAAELLALICAGLPLLGFSAGDPPRRPWALRSAAVGLVFTAHALQRLAGASGPLDLLLLIAANLLGAAAVLGFLQVLRRSGLAAPMTGPGAALVGLLALAAALVVAAIAARIAPVADLRAAALLVSTFCDALVFVGSAALLRRIYALRGGLVARPYLLLALDGSCFLCADLGHAFGGVALAAALPLLGALGGAAGAAAGLAQAALLRRR